MSNALLLRLFTSEFFNSWIAVSYLFRYPDNVGIQHYLCSELEKFPASEIEFFLPQLIHLLITRPTESVALECFLVEMCEKSTHMAIMSLWYLQAYLSDLSSNPVSPSFDLCKRLLNKCQAIVFSDGSPEASGIIDPVAAANVGLPAQKVRENAMPALVGIGAMLAGIGQPIMTKPAGRIAIAQGRRNRPLSITSSNDPILARRNTLPGATPAEDRDIRPIVHLESSGKDSYYSDSHSIGSLSPTQSSFPSHFDVPLPFQSASQPELPIIKRRSSQFMTFNSSPSLEDLHRGKAFSVGRYLKNAHQKLNQKMRPTARLPSKALSVFDPKLTALGQSSVPTNFAPLSPAMSHCSTSSEDYILDARRHGARISTSFDSNDSGLKSDVQDADSDLSDEDYSALSKLSVDHRKLLLRSNYFRSEMQFLLALVDIATRLVIVPKAARMSALHAELTLLNHNLPAEICIPLWCPATAEKPYHHRVVRISPSDAVVLNSAERAPYLLMIEVLDDELSFEDDYSSALYRMRRMMKREKKKSSSKPASARTSLTLPLGITAHSSPLAEQSPSEESSSEDKQAAQETDAAPVSDETEATSPGLLEVTKTSGDAVEQRRVSRSADEYAERMRTAAVMLAQLQQSCTNASTISSAKSKQETEQIRQRIIKEMIALEEQRMTKMKTEGVSSGVGGGGGEGAGGDLIEDEQHVAWVVNKEDPSAAVFSEDWETKKARIRASSPYGHLPNWRLLSVIVKNGADLRQEQFAIQLIREMQRIWEDTGVDVWVKYFRVLVTSDNSGLIETLRNTISIHSIKKDAYTRHWNQKGIVFTLRDYFERTYGNPESDEFLKAQDAFMRSLAGYSIACYILQIKDRHNGNLLVDNMGHLIHIDFGFMLSNSPGSVGFEMAAFKLPQEYIDLLGGIYGEKFAEYKALMKAAFLAVRKHSENILLLVEMMCRDSKLPCFQNGDQTVQQLRDRFQLHLTEPQAEEFVDKLIMSSCCNVFTRLYDTYQYYSQGIL
ncbi:kinase-like domain-containing protein [Radiomyces spectabilis]|uniref:kinase-like domain-containing protein n=1 Tax=Radiomyces spectabilis TaxID=64574 RepID=UPI00221E70C6|nr:kinase-like domain-containing protein [Radiomyces spectabilis]KAI8393409.1 kinase-like domain-containing protein [Radiomyces spectabilis]